MWIKFHILQYFRDNQTEVKNFKIYFVFISTFPFCNSDYTKRVNIFYKSWKLSLMFSRGCMQFFFILESNFRKNTKKFVSIKRGEEKGNWFHALHASTMFHTETQAKRQATQHDCWPNLLGDVDKWTEIVYEWGKNFCTRPTRAAKAGQKSLVSARWAQRTNHGRALFIFTLWVPICINFNSQQGPSLSRLSCFAYHLKKTLICFDPSHLLQYW